jgi:hypothetical protein
MKKESKIQTVLRALLEGQRVKLGNHYYEVDEKCQDIVAIFRKDAFPTEETHPQDFGVRSDMTMQQFFSAADLLNDDEVTIIGANLSLNKYNQSITKNRNERDMKYKIKNEDDLQYRLYNRLNDDLWDLLWDRVLNSNRLMDRVDDLLWDLLQNRLRNRLWDRLWNRLIRYEV